MKEKGYLLWDFDGTLGYRKDGLRGDAWSMSMVEAIKRVDPKTTISHEQIRPYISSKYDWTKTKHDDVKPHIDCNFPWHEPEVEHFHLNTPELWWAHLRNVFYKVYRALGFTESESKEISNYVQPIFLDLSYWELFDDTLDVLNRLEHLGWHHMIVSNHVPELKTITGHLGLNELVPDMINSAEVGVEKPHPLIFNTALEKANHSENVWMIGDNIIADVLGAERAGINGVLVRENDSRAKYRFNDLKEFYEFIAGI